jgi:hypothetical protein
MSYVNSRLLVFSALLLAAAGTLLASDRVPVLLELFTSEGCSSCPPADQLLETLDRTQPVANVELVVLSEHVDYWDGLGWKDPYSSAAITERQRDYGRKFHLDGVYTPQLVVDGRFELVGSRGGDVKSAIEKAAHDGKTSVSISQAERQGNQIHFRLDVAALPSSAGSDAVFVALAESHAESKVLRGENSGRVLSHVASVRSLAAVGSLKAGNSFANEISLPVPQGAGRDLRIVAFVQDKATGRVFGTTRKEI